MAREAVTGYCWPQSVKRGEQVGLHMSSSQARPVRVEIARVGGQRDVVFTASSVATGEHATPKAASSNGCDWPVALAVDVPETWRSGYYEVVMEIDVGEKVRRDYAFFVNNLAPPSESFLVELRGPDDDTWSWGPQDAGQRITGSAEDFCFLVTQRRPLSTLDVKAVGGDAQRWLKIAQAFAGPPGPGR